MHGTYAHTCNLRKYSPSDYLGRCMCYIVSTYYVGVNAEIFQSILCSKWLVMYLLKAGTSLRVSTVLTTSSVPSFPGGPAPLT